MERNGGLSNFLTWMKLKNEKRSAGRSEGVDKNAGCHAGEKEMNLRAHFTLKLKSR